RQVGQSDNKSNNKKDEDTSPQKEPEPKSRLKDKVQKVKDLVTRDKEPVCTLEQARDKWSELLEAINGDSPSLTFVLKMAQIVDINGNTISITVPYEFHKDKLECKKCRKQIESHLANIFDSKIKLAIEVVEEVKEKEDPELQELASALGGEIVN
ncbi:hypothetical protein KKB40_01950, partial [Patescibacteria group bacterium]|nr:hypothetical protein [Patescibacteria group bacterium]